MPSLLERLRAAVGMDKSKKPTKVIKTETPLNTRQRAARQIPGKAINKIADRNAKIEKMAKDLEL